MHQHEIEQQPTHASIAVSEGVNSLKVMMGNCGPCDRFILIGRVTAEPLDPLLHIQRDLTGRRWREVRPSDRDLDAAQLACAVIDLLHDLPVQGKDGRARDWLSGQARQAIKSGRRIRRFQVLARR